MGSKQMGQSWRKEANEHCRCIEDRSELWRESERKDAIAVVVVVSMVLVSNLSTH